MTTTARHAPAKQGGQVRRQASASSVTLTGRGGIVLIFGFGLLGALITRWVGVGAVAGGTFVAGCILAAVATRPTDLLTLAVSPPAVLFVVTFLAELVDALGEPSLARTLSVGLVTAFASVAPWLFLGTVLVVGIAIPRGLLTNLRELRARLAGGRQLEEDDNIDPVRWDESPSPNPHHGDVD